MSIKLIAAGLLLAMLLAAGWRIHHNVYESGVQAQAAKDKVLIDQLSSANSNFREIVAQVESDKAACENGRIADANASKAATDAADKARAGLIADANTARRKLADKMSGECREWASQPACGSTP
jgi:predicted negative regulator of RcsB-dependent stress response